LDFSAPDSSGLLRPVSSCSPYYGIDTNFSSFLGGIERDPDGRIIKAKSTILHFINQKVDQHGDVIDARDDDRVSTGAIMDTVSG
jgi:hypothetical protein